MTKDEAVRNIAEALRGIYIKLDKLYDLTGLEVYEYLYELDQIVRTIIDLLDVPPWEKDREIVYQYLQGEFDYDEMLAKIKHAQETFNPDDYAKYLEEYEKYIAESVFGDRD